MTTMNENTQIMLRNNANDSKVLDKIVFIGQRRAVKSSKDENLTKTKIEIVK